MIWIKLLGVASALALNTVAAAEPKPAGRAMWVWDTAVLLADEQKRDAFLDFTERHRITTVWTYVATRATTSGREVERPAAWAALVASAHARNITVHALDGDPDYAQRAKHERALSTIDAVIAYNRAAAPHERFDGIHFDVEPYLLPEWKDERVRPALLADYLDLNRRAAARAHANGLAYGVDLPFWWNIVQEATGETPSSLTVAGVRRPVVDALLEIVDTVGVMDYRTRADGADGLIENALYTITRANAIGKATVFIGVETDRVQESPARVSFAGGSAKALNAELAATDTALRHHRSYGGIAIHHYASYRHLVEPADRDRD